MVWYHILDNIKSWILPRDIAYFNNRRELERPYCFLWWVRFFIFSLDLDVYLFVVCTVLYLFESSIWFHDCWLNIFEECNVHALKVIDIEFLNSCWCKYWVVCIEVKLFLFDFGGCWTDRMILGLQFWVILEYAVLFSLYIHCKLINIALLQILSNQLQLCFSFISYMFFLFIYNESISVFKCILSAPFKMAGDFRPFF